MSTDDLTKCPICQKAAAGQAVDALNRMLRYDCERCGRFQITEEAAVDLQGNDMLPHLFKVSAYLRERDISKEPAVTIVSSSQSLAQMQGAAIDVESIVSSFPRNVSDRLDRVLRNIQRLSAYPGARFRLKVENGYPVFFAENPDACWYIGQILEELGWLKTDSSMGHLGGIMTVKGWNRIAELERGNEKRDSRQVFVAMWFDGSLEKPYKEGIERAIQDAGYQALRMDLKEHNEKICDAIIAEIRKCRFMVADFTGHREGVYFEAGFARGLGIEVISTVREDDLDKTHFDTRQYNHIVWKNEQDLYEKLKRRIEATITS